MKRNLFLFLLVALFSNSYRSQVTSINLLYNSVPGIGCYSNMSVCTNTGSLPESGAQIVVDWMDGDTDTMMVYSSPNSQNCYVFEHSYSLAGIYNALVTVTSGTAVGQVIGGETIEWVITNTSNCGFFNVITLLNPSATFLSNIPYDITDNSGVTTTIYPVNSFGNWYYTELDIANTPYTVSVNPGWLQSNGYIQTSPNFTINSFDLTGKAENIPMSVSVECAGNGAISNLEVSSASAFQFVAPIEQGNVSVQVCNVSCGNFANSTIKIALPNGVTPDLSLLPNASYLNDTVTILEPYLSGCITYGFPCSFAGNTPSGTLFDFSVNVSAQGEQDLLFNQMSFFATVLNSYDPNDKQCNLSTYIQPDVQEKLQYTVRFQNDGNYPALNVVVRDTISSNLNLSTLKFLTASHPVTYTIDPITREIVFRFSGIQLVPSSENLEASQGYFSYEIIEQPNLPLNSEILNTAYIYFDFNPPIITNTTLNINGYVGISEQTNKSMVIFPNPSSGSFEINGPEDGQLRITSLSGSLILDQYYDKGDVIDLSNVESGLYIIRIINQIGEFNQKLNLIKD